MNFKWRVVMRSMKFNALEIVLRSFASQFRIWDSPEGGMGGGDPEGGTGTAVADAGDAPGKEGAANKGGEAAPKSEPISIKDYRGSKTVNPDQRPLKNFVREGMSTKQIDAMIAEAGEEIYLSKEAIVDAEKKNEDGDKPGKKDGEAKPDDKKGDETDPEVKEFYEKTGLSEKEFTALPEKIQETLTKAFSSVSEGSTKYADMEKQMTQLKTDLSEVSKDPVIAARLEEKATGRAYVATQLPKFTAAEVAKIENLLVDGKTDEAVNFLNKELEKRTQDAVKHERSVSDKQQFRANAETKAQDVFKAIGKMDSRVAIDEDDWNSITSNRNHPKYKAFQDGPGDLIKYCIDRHISLETVTKSGAKEIYAQYAAFKGWDKERDKKIADSSKKTLLDKLRDPKKARTLDAGKPSVEPQGKDSSLGFSRDALIDDISQGNMENWERQLEAADGNVKTIAILGEVRRLGEQKFREKHSK